MSAELDAVVADRVVARADVEEAVAAMGSPQVFGHDFRGARFAKEAHAHAFAQEAGDGALGDLPSRRTGVRSDKDGRKREFLLQIAGLDDCGGGCDIAVLGGDVRVLVLFVAGSGEHASPAGCAENHGIQAPVDGFLRGSRSLEGMI